MAQKSHWFEPKSKTESRQHSYPVLSYKVMFTALEQIPIVCEMQICKNDFTDPQLNRWRHIWATFTEVLTHVPIEVISQRRALKRREPPEPISELFVFYRVLNELLVNGGMQNFKLTEFLMPEDITEKRLKDIMSCLINMQKYFFIHEQKLEDVDNNHRQRLKDLRSIKDENASLRTEIDKMHQTKKQLEAQQIQLSAQSNENQHKMAEMNEQDTEIKKLFSDLRQDISEKALISAQLKSNLAELQQEKVDLESKIVQSPEQYHNMMCKMEEQLAKIKEEHSVLNGRFKSAMKNIEEIRAMDGALDDMNKSCNDINGLSDFITQAKNEAETFVKRIHNLQVKVQDANRLIAEKEAAIAKNGEVNSKLKFQHEQKTASLRNTLDEIKQKSKKSATKNSQQDIQSCLDDLADGFDAIEMKVDKEKDRYTEDVVRIENLVEKAHQKLVYDWREYLQRFYDGAKDYVTFDSQFEQLFKK